MKRFWQSTWCCNPLKNWCSEKWSKYDFTYRHTLHTLGSSLSLECPLSIVVIYIIHIYIYIHGGPTGMVVANMAVHGPFFQPANVEGTGSHHSWLWGEQSVHAYITTCGPKASLDTGIPPSLSTWPKETQRLLWNKEGLPDTPHNQRCLRMLAWLDMYGGPGNATPIIAIFNIQHWNNIDSGGVGVLTAQHLVCIG